MTTELERMSDADLIDIIENSECEETSSAAQNEQSRRDAMITRDMARPFVSYVVDDAGAARNLGADCHAIIRESGEFAYPSILVGFRRRRSQSLVFVAVHSYLSVKLSDTEARELSGDYLKEIGIIRESQSAVVVIR